MRWKKRRNHLEGFVGSMTKSKLKRVKAVYHPYPIQMGVPEQIVEVRERERDEIELISFESQFEL